MQKLELTKWATDWVHILTSAFQMSLIVGAKYSSKVFSFLVFIEIFTLIHGVMKKRLEPEIYKINLLSMILMSILTGAMVVILLPDLYWFWAVVFTNTAIFYIRYFYYKESSNAK